MLRRNTRLICGAAGVVLSGSLLGGSLPGAAWADAVPGTSPSASAMPGGTARPGWCTEVGALERRLGRDIRRLEAGTSARGSMARTRQQWRIAAQGHHGGRAQASERRLAWRRELLGVLLTLRRELRWVAGWCAMSMPTASASASAVPTRMPVPTPSATPSAMPSDPAMLSGRTGSHS
jgi:hypothetical protein